MDKRKAPKVDPAVAQAAARLKATVAANLAALRTAKAA